MNSFRETTTRRAGTARILQFPQPKTMKVLVPREHGSWGLWLLPLITGAVVGATNNPGPFDWAIFWFCAASAAAFLAYQPLEVLLGFSPIKPRSLEEKQMAATWVIFTCFIAGISAIQLVISGRGRVLFFALLAAGCFTLRMLISKVRALRAARQVIAALALSSSAAASYYVISGKMDLTALLLWLANWMFAAGQITYVQLRIRTAGAQSRVEKSRAGWRVYLFHLAMLGLAVSASLTRQVSPLAALIFVPAVARLLIWASRRPAKINFYVLGLSELLQSVLFSSLLIVAFVWR